jgi:hypothetical protein
MHTAVEWSDNSFVIFGGEDVSGRVLNDLWMFDTDTLAWTKLGIDSTEETLSHTSFMWLVIAISMAGIGLLGSLIFGRIVERRKGYVPIS